MRVEWRLIPPPCAWRFVFDCIYGSCISSVSILACSCSLKLRCKTKIPGYLIARVMASDEPILSAEAAKEIRCAQCNEPVDVLAPGVRCRNKQKQQFACGKCLSVDARLRKLLGTWLVNEMKDATEQDTFDFYRRAAAANGPHSLRVQLKSALKKEVKKSKNNRQLGEWLPLSVCEKRGWAADVIERHEKKTDATKGILYRIGVEQDIDEEVEETVEQRLRELIPKTKCAKETFETLPNMPSTDPDAQDPLFKQNDDGDVSVSSSSSSSSSSSVKKKKKKKKGSGSRSKTQLKKERKAKLAAEKQKELEKQRKAAEKQATAEERRQNVMRRKAEKEVEAKAAADAKKAKVATQNAIAKIKTDALKVLAKSAGPNVDIETIMERGEWERYPTIMKVQIQNCLKELSAMYDEAKSKFGDRVPIPLSFDMAALNKIVADIKTIQKSLNDLGQTDA